MVRNGGHLIYSVFVLFCGGGTFYQSADNHLYFKGVTVSAWVAFSISLLLSAQLLRNYCHFLLLQSKCQCLPPNRFCSLSMNMETRKNAHVNQVYSDRAVALFYMKIQEPFFFFLRAIFFNRLKTTFFKGKRRVFYSINRSLTTTSGRM